MFTNYLKKKEEKNARKSQKSEDDFHSFIQEELDFYQKLNNKKKRVEVPFPCDTYVRFNKQAFKFENVTPPLSEMVTLFYFSKLFKVEYKVLKKCYKNIEKIVEDRFK